jgi:hypothetical protein
MLDHDLDFRPTFAELCEERGVCPDCGGDFDDCPCVEDLLFERETQRHPSGCLCCLGDLVDVRFPPVRRQVAA